MLFAALAATLLPSFAFAQNVFTVNVAEGGLKFTPSNINNVSNNDIIQFVFAASGHSVTQSTLADPCTTLDGGFNSGFSSAAGDVWNLTITDASKPIWYFCAQTQPSPHCEAGMVGAVNSPEDTFSSFSSAATAATVIPSFSAVVLTGSGAAATASPTTASVVSGTSIASSGASSGSTTTSGAPASSSTSAAKPFAGFEGAGAGLLALFGAFLL